MKEKLKGLKRKIQPEVKEEVIEGIKKNIHEIEVKMDIIRYN